MYSRLFINQILQGDTQFIHVKVFEEQKGFFFAKDVQAYIGKLTRNLRV